MAYMRVTLIPALLFAAIPLMAHSQGADPGFSGAPGDDTCTACHGGRPNTGSGRVTLTFANGNTYTPGQTQRVTVSISDPAARRWGFEVSPRLASDASNKSTGKLVSVDGNTQVLPPGGALQWITHTGSGTRLGTTGSITFQFDWTAPDSDVGSVDFYAAANAANGNGRNDTGDLIYTTKATLTASAAPVSNKPSISQNGVVNGASFKPGITQGSWISILGTNLATNTRIWDSAKEIVNGKLPASLDGTSVTINGKPAPVYFISPTQLNVQAPSDDNLGNINLVVTTSAGQSDPITAVLQQFTPAFFLFDPQNRKYLAAVASDGASLGPAGLFGAAVTTRPAKPGEVILLFGTGFGATTPSVPTGEVFNGAAQLTNPVTLTIGGVQAEVLFAGLSAAGLYQFNVTVPATVANGDQAVVASIGGVQTQDGAFLAIQR
jgi:uncharacterized protein (TIGR03437 family)